MRLLVSLTVTRFYAIKSVSIKSSISEEVVLKVTAFTSVLEDEDIVSHRLAIGRSNSD